MNYKESQLDDFVADLAGEVVITISTPDRELSINFNQINGLSQYQVEYLVDEIQKYKTSAEKT